MDGNEQEARKSAPEVSIIMGSAFGVLGGICAIAASIMSAGAGHGDYVFARALFPIPMLLTLLDGTFGPVSVGVALLQFPLYGALLTWTIWRNSYWAIAIAGMVHLVAAGACFAGLIPNFS